MRCARASMRMGAPRLEPGLVSAWAGLIAISCWPLYRRFSARILGGRSPALSALLFSILTGLVLLVPLVLATHQIAQGSEAFAQSLNQMREHGIPVPAWLARLP